MGDFLRFCWHNIRDYRYLVWGLFFAFLSAFSLGAGLLSMIPILKLILDPDGQDRGLHEWAHRFNEGDHWVKFPQWTIDLVPEGRLQGVIFVLGFIIFLTIFGGYAISCTSTTRSRWRFGPSRG